MPTPLTDDAETLRFRGSTVESALDSAEKSLGGRVKLVAANRLRRGGIGGFFASDMGVEVVVSLEHETIEEALQRLVEGTAAEEREEWRRQVAASAARTDQHAAAPSSFASVAATVANAEIPPVAPSVGASVASPDASSVASSVGASAARMSVEPASDSEFIEFLAVEKPTIAIRAGTNLDALAAAINGAKPKLVTVAAAANVVGTKPAAGGSAADTPVMKPTVSAASTDAVETQPEVLAAATTVLVPTPKVVAAATNRRKSEPKTVAAATRPTRAKPKPKVPASVIAEAGTVLEIGAPQDLPAPTESPTVVIAEPAPFKPSPVLLRRHVELAVAAADELIAGLTHTPNVKSITARVIVRSGHQYEVEMEARWESHEEPRP